MPKGAPSLPSLSHERQSCAHVRKRSRSGMAHLLQVLLVNKHMQVLQCLPVPGTRQHPSRIHSSVSEARVSHSEPSPPPSVRTHSMTLPPERAGWDVRQAALQACEKWGAATRRLRAVPPGNRGRNPTG